MSDLRLVRNRRIPDAEMTAYPWWFIVDPPVGRIISKRNGAATVALCIDGPFFSREEAEDYLARTRYNYSDHAIVWCGSGHKSKSWRAFCEEEVP